MSIKNPPLSEEGGDDRQGGSLNFCKPFQINSFHELLIRRHLQKTVYLFERLTG